jgi:hypothetical protein
MLLPLASLCHVPDMVSHVQILQQVNFCLDMCQPRNPIARGVLYLYHPQLTFREVPQLNLLDSHGLAGAQIKSLVDGPKRPFS